MRRSRLAVLSLVILLTALVGFCSASESRRDRWLQPERVLDTVGLHAGMTVAEVGAGRGYFTVKLARRVGPEGAVYANDISSSALTTLEERCADEDLTNVSTVHGDVDHPRLPENALDMVFLVYALHDFTQPVEVLENLKPSLRAGATVVLLDQDPDITDDDHFLRADRVLEIFNEAGYRLVRRESFLERDLLMVFCVADES
jgi:ubiquinone/menaquinone biosynthesis C-methylase UbiE